MVLVVALLLGALIGITHPAVIVAILAYAGIKLRDSEGLLSCCSGYPTRKLIVCGKVL